MVHDIAERVTSFDLDDLSPYALQRLQLILLANLSVAVAGVPFCAFQEPPPGGPYRLFSGHCTAGARDAAFWNAAVMHARTQDDFHPVGNNHIGTVVIPALLAIADEIPVTGRQFLSALAVGYMVAVGMSRRFSPLTSPRGLRSTSLYCPFGATAAVARLRGANSEQIANALALTTCFAGGTTQTWIDGSDEFQLHVALAAEAGLRAVDLARAGVTGASGALDGAAGFFNAFTGERPTFGDIAADFEPSAAIGDCVIKRYPVSGICQSVVLASERMAAQLPRLDAISRVQLSMNGFELNYPRHRQQGTLPLFQLKAHERSLLLRVSPARPRLRSHRVSRCAVGGARALDRQRRRGRGSRIAVAVGHPDRRAHRWLGVAGSHNKLARGSCHRVANG